MLVTAGTNGITDGEVGDEKRELGKMEQGCVVMKSLKVLWEKEKSTEREGCSSWGIVLLRMEALTMVSSDGFFKIDEDIPPEWGSLQVQNTLEQLHLD